MQLTSIDLLLRLLFIWRSIFALLIPGCDTTTGLTTCFLDGGIIRLTMDNYCKTMLLASAARKVMSPGQCSTSSGALVSENTLYIENKITSLLIVVCRHERDCCHQKWSHSWYGVNASHLRWKDAEEAGRREGIDQDADSRPSSLYTWTARVQQQDELIEIENDII